MASLQKLQNRAARIITGASYLKRSCDLLAELGWLNLEAMRQRQKAILMFKVLNGLTPPYLSEMFTHETSFQNYGLRSSKMNLELPKCHTNYYKNSLAFSGAKLWNDLPASVKDESSLKRFVCLLDSYTSGTSNASK